MTLFKKIYYFFSNYTNPDEKKIAKVFSKITEKSHKATVINDLTSVIQTNIIATNLWGEYRYKGYRYLNKYTRAKLYSNALAIASEFEKFTLANKENIKDIQNEIVGTGIRPNDIDINSEKLIYLRQIMRFLSIENGLYVYRSSSTFGELLKIPYLENLVGDCNQIVTLYIYLYSIKYDVRDLQLITYPGHVALIFNGIGVEATSGKFKNFNETDQKYVPIVEIISINLLDTTDSAYKTYKIQPKYLLESARIAYIISSDRSIVKKNLDIAYNNNIAELIKSNDFSLALKYAKQSGKLDLINVVGNNGAIYYMNNNKFVDAIKYAKLTIGKEELLKNIFYNQGIFHYNRHDYDKAIESFTKVNNEQLIRQCYIGLFNQEQKKIKSISSSEDIRNNKQTIIRMHDYAKKSGKMELIEYTSSLMKYL